MPTRPPLRSTRVRACAHVINSLVAKAQGPGCVGRAWWAGVHGTRARTCATPTGGAILKGFLVGIKAGGDEAGHRHNRGHDYDYQTTVAAHDL